ncbi:MAG: hypothetical protein ACE3L7_14570 [Candidatus Pristimantibacillus sp.]
MKLATMEVVGFKLYKEKQTFTFGLANHIQGGRGMGKTALCEAIVWCLKGCDLTGSVRGIRKRLQNWATKEIHVVTQWDFPQADHSLIRHTFCRVTKGRITRLYLDEIEVDQSDFDKLIGTTHTFLSVFSPGYYGGLSAVSARDFILSLLPALAVDTVIHGMTDEEQTRLQPYKLSDPLQCLKDLQVELAEWDTHIQEIERKINTMRLSESFLGASSHIQEDQKRITSLKQQLESIKQSTGLELPHYVTEWEEELVQLGVQYRALVARSKEIMSAEQLSGIHPLEVERSRQIELRQIKKQAEAMLQKGHNVKDRIASERKQFEKDQAEYSTSLSHEMQHIEIEIAKLEGKQAVHINNSKRAEGLVSIQNLLSRETQERDRVRAEIQLIHQFMLQYADIQVKAANRELSLVEILLIKKHKADGEPTLQYKLLYNKKEYYSLTNPEKIRCSFELSTLVNRVQGRLIPVFVDNGELVESFVQSQTQFFATSVIPDATLSHEIIVA